MTSRDSYRRKAEACLDAARKLHVPEQRISMLRIAALYMDLADQIDSREAAARRRASHVPDHVPDNGSRRYM